jgi:hypothetical protein
MLQARFNLHTPKYDNQDQQGKATFNERNPHMTQQKETVNQNQKTDMLEQAQSNMINKINKERRRSMNATEPATFYNFAVLGFLQGFCFSLFHCHIRVICSVWRLLKVSLYI